VTQALTSPGSRTEAAVDLDGLLRGHLLSLHRALETFGAAAGTATRMGVALARRLPRGGRLFVAGNGGSAAQAEHLSGEIVGRYCNDRRPFSAVALHADGSASTAIANDYGWDEVYARQLEAHARPGDIAVLLSTSGRSANMVAAAHRARHCGVESWALTGAAPNPLAAASDWALTIDADTTATVQELHLVALHLMCEAFDAELERGLSARVNLTLERP
jgi:D-sedoheptulose 7-phosphate isomerase